jgi:hypothetical protein
MWPNRPNTTFRWHLRYLVFAAAFFLRSAHRFFIISDSFLRPAGLSLLAGFALTALLLGALLAASLVCEFEFDAVRIFAGRGELRNFVVDLLHDSRCIHLVVSFAKLSGLAYSFLSDGSST